MSRPVFSLFAGALQVFLLLPATAGAQITGRPILGDRLTQEAGAFYGSTNALIGIVETPRHDRIPSAIVRLRNLLTGEVSASQVTDKTGRYTFRSITPSTYVVEVIGADERVIAVSEAVTVASNEVQQAIVTLAGRTAIPGWTHVTSAVTTAASAAGIGWLAPGAPVSPDR